MTTAETRAATIKRCACSWWMWILLVAIVLRLSLILWGIPWYYLSDLLFHGSTCSIPEVWIASHPDEYVFVYDADRFPRSIFLKPNYPYPYPTLVPNLVHTGFAANSVLSLIHQDVAKGPSLLFYFHLFGRAVVVFLGVTTVFVAAWEARRRWGREAGIVCGLVLAVMPYHVQTSAFFTADVAVALLVLLGAMAARRLWEFGGREDYLMAGIITGLAVAAKQPGVIVAVAVLGYHAMAMIRKGRRFFSREFGCSILVAAAAFVIASPRLLVHWRDLQAFTRATFHLLQSINTSFSWPTRAGLLLYEHAEILTPFFAVVVLMSFAHLLFRRRWEEWPIAAMVIAFWAAPFSVVFPRYLVVLLPLFAMYGAGFLGGGMKSRRRSVRWMAYGTAAAVIGHALFLDLHAIWWRWNDPQAAARTFIERAIPPGKGIGVMATESWCNPFVYLCRYRIEALESGAEYLALTEFNLQHLARTEQGPALVDDGMAVASAETARFMPMLEHLLFGAPPPPGKPSYERIASFSAGGMATRRFQLPLVAEQAGSGIGALGVFLKAAFDLRHFRVMEIFPNGVEIYRRKD